MPAKGHTTRGLRTTAAERAVMKAEAVRLRGEALTIREIASRVGVSRRTISDWRQKDEKFAVAMSEADKDNRDFWVDKCRAYALDDSKPLQAQMLMFMTKQADPSFRDNAKIEVTAGKGLAASLKKLAELGAD